MSKLLKVMEVAELLRISRSLAFQLVQQGDIPSVRIGERALRVSEEALEEYLRKHTTPVAAGRK